MGKTRISNNGNKIIVFLFTNEPAAAYNLLLPSITFDSHYIRNTWNDRSSVLRPETCQHAAGAALNRLKRNAVPNPAILAKQNVSRLKRAMREVGTDV